jgi:hypothetical protein
MMKKPASTDNRSKIVAVRFGDKDFAALEKYAAKDRRAVSTVVWMIVTDLLKAEGLLK